MSAPAANAVSDGLVIGVAGCGAMGLPMALRLMAAGFSVYGLDVRPREAFGALAPRMLDDPRAFAARCDVVICVVRDSAQIRALCFEQQALFAASPHPRTLVISSTVAPGFVHELRAELPAAVTLVDAPMSGAPHAAQSGRLSFMLGGDDADLDRLLPYLRAMGEQLFRLGPLGAGMTAKVLNNYVASTAAVAVRRVYRRAALLGVDLARLNAVMAASSGATWFGDNFERIDWAHEGYSPDNTIGILEKDVRSCLAAVEGLEGGEPDSFDAALLDALRSLRAFGEAGET